MPNAHTKTLTTTQTTDYRIALGKAMIAQGATYKQINRKTGLSSSTIAKIKRGEYKTLQPLAESIKAHEHENLSNIGMLASELIQQKLVEALTGETDQPLIPVVAALDRAFQQRRTLEGEASVIYDHKTASTRIDDRSKRIADLKRQLGREADDDVDMRRDSKGVFVVDE